MRTKSWVVVIGLVVMAIVAIMFITQINPTADQNIGAVATINAGGASLALNPVVDANAVVTENGTAIGQVGAGNINEVTAIVDTLAVLGKDASGWMGSHTERMVAATSVHIGESEGRHVDRVVAAHFLAITSSV